MRILGDSGYSAEYTRKDESKTYAVVARASTEGWSEAMETVRRVAYQHGGTIKDSRAEDWAADLVKGARQFCDYRGPRRGT